MATSLSVISYFLFYGFSNFEALQTVYRLQRGKVLFLPAPLPSREAPQGPAPSPDAPSLTTPLSPDPLPPYSPAQGSSTPLPPPHVQAPPHMAPPKSPFHHPHIPLPWLRPRPHGPSRLRCPLPRPFFPLPHDPRDPSHGPAGGGFRNKPGLQSLILKHILQEMNYFFLKR